MATPQQRAEEAVTPQALVSSASRLLDQLKAARIRDVIKRFGLFLERVFPIRWDPAQRRHVKIRGAKPGAMDVLESIEKNVQEIATSISNNTNSGDKPHARKEGNNMAKSSGSFTFSAENFELNEDQSKVSVDFSELSDKKRRRLLEELGAKEYKDGDFKDGDVLIVNDGLATVIKRGENFWLVVSAVAGLAVVIGVLGTLGVQWMLGDASETAGATDGQHLHAM